MPCSSKEHQNGMSPISAKQKKKLGLGSSGSSKKKMSNNNNNERVPLTEEIRQLLKISPFVSVPQIVIEPALAKDGTPLVTENGTQLYCLPVSKNCILNGILSKSPPKKPQDIRDDDSKKAPFLLALDLFDHEAAERRKINLEEKGLCQDLQKKLKSRKGQVVSFFKNNPLPLSSTLGKKIVKSGIAKCNNPKDEIDKYEKYCSSSKFRKQGIPGQTTWPQVNVRRAKIKPGQHVHTYSYGRRQRITRKVELTVGLSTKSFALLNSCRHFTVRVKNLTDDQVARKMQNLMDKQSVQKSGPKLRDYTQLRWVASEPTAGPSRCFERIANPVIELYDIRNSPTKQMFFQ